MVNREDFLADLSKMCIFHWEYEDFGSYGSHLHSVLIEIRGDIMKLHPKATRQEIRRGSMYIQKQFMKKLRSINKSLMPSLSSQLSLSCLETA